MWEMRQERGEANPGCPAAAATAERRGQPYPQESLSKGQQPGTFDY